MKQLEIEEQLCGALDRDLVTATIAMAHSLNLDVVAEGVETGEQLKLLNGLGCDVAQGYYFSRPIPKLEMMKFDLKKRLEAEC